MKNDVDKELTSKNLKNRYQQANRFKNWYQDYLAHPNAQYRMTYAQYRRKRMKKGKDKV